MISFVWRKKSQFYIMQQTFDKGIEITLVLQDVKLH